MKIKQKFLSYKLVIGVLSVFAIVGFTSAYVGGTPKNVIEGDYIEAGNQVAETLGGQTVSTEYFQNSFVDGGSTVTFAPTGNATTTAAMICQYKNLEVTPTGATVPALQIELPASADLINYCLPTKNDTWTIYYSNESATAATTTTLVIKASDTMELLEPDGSDVVIPGAEDAIIEFRNAGGGVVKATVTSVRAAD